ncbi:MAG: EF-hand domain-containing protein [Dechloromonas sp.]|nr:EF-hand domain-containing protein [Dechloromonas sp.]
MVSGINQSSQMASQLFSRLDTKNQGYIEKSDLASAFSSIASQKSDSTSADDVFAALDGDSDGKVTENELSTVLAKLQEQLDSQFNQSRMQGMGGHGGAQGMAGMPPPPPPPPGGDAGFTKDELSAQLESADSSDTQRTSLLNKVVENFEAADSNSDGKVSFQEAMAYDQSSSSSASSDSASATQSTADSDEAKIMMKIMQLMHAYGSGQDDASSGLANLLSVSA